MLDVAARLADERGYPNLTLAMLAAELGIRSQSLYAHVDGIAGLRDGLALLGQAMLADDLRDAAMARTRSDALRSVVHAMADFADTHPGSATSSASQVRSSSPVAARAPAFRAWFGPRTGEASTTRTPSHRAAIAALRSLDPLSATTISSGPW